MDARDVSSPESNSRWRTYRQPLPSTPDTPLQLPKVKLLTPSTPQSPLSEARRNWKVSSDPESDPFLSHLEKQISQKTRELECPVCFVVCQPPILRCPEFHLVCGECWPRMRVCGECRAPYEGQMRHRYAERGHQELQELVRVREEHLKKNTNLPINN
eukprot:GFUD01136794.1.p1 GENE.GFUD01136794.1~~GFUD01136794.1.p1  ORF type:complete len:158 (-),score=45.91 GFUD01136794.1:33-506(-)